jgi:hypothetical protein
VLLVGFAEDEDEEEGVRFTDAPAAAYEQLAQLGFHLERTA